VNKLRVDLGERSYNIMIGSGILDEAGALIKAQAGVQKVLLVSNPLVFSLYGERVLNSLAGQGMKVAVAQMPDGEQFKNVKEAMKIVDQAVRAGLERSSAVVALGGGVVGDLAGFVAAIYQRGIRLVQIPTTLLSQVDSSVGGKVAVNHRQGKNLIGAFHQPALVIIDSNTLLSLSSRDYLSGLGEVVKYGITFDADFVCYLEKHREQILNRDKKVLEAIIHSCCELKRMIVAQDEREDDLRMSLNLGHTFGHALEKLGRYRVYTHGEAVAIGTVAAAILATKLGMLNEQDLKRIGDLYQGLGLETRFPGYPPATVYRHMQNDKKVKEGQLRLVLPEGIGHFTIRDDVPRRAVIEAIASAQSLPV
jgi:3-dehydroquinate synthase